MISSHIFFFLRFQWFMWVPFHVLLGWAIIFIRFQFFMWVPFHVLQSSCNAGERTRGNN
jgi:hypothetical protein